MTRLGFPSTSLVCGGNQPEILVGIPPPAKIMPGPHFGDPPHWGTRRRDMRSRERPSDYLTAEEADQFYRWFMASFVVLTTIAVMAASPIWP